MSANVETFRRVRIIIGVGSEYKQDNCDEAPDYKENPTAATTSSPIATTTAAVATSIAIATPTIAAVTAPTTFADSCTVLVHDTLTGCCNAICPR